MFFEYFFQNIQEFTTKEIVTYAILIIQSVIITIIVSYLFAKIGIHYANSDSEAASSTERIVASSGDALAREFQQRARREIDDAVNRLGSTSDEVIKSKLTERIDQVLSDGIVEILGTKITEQTEELAQLNRLRQEASDRFIQMSNRALQYAEAANRQSTFFRWIGIILSIAGLAAIGYAFAQNLQQFQNNPDLLKQHIEWEILFLRHAPTLAFVTLCEFLALVMFRYQSKSLEYMRYFSNEATNMDSRHIAFLSAMRFMDKTKFAKLIERLDATERNFIIGKDQRTLEMANNDGEDRVVEKLLKRLTPWQTDGEKPATGSRRRRATKDES